MSVDESTGIENSTIYGYVTDEDTGNPYVDVSIDIFKSSDHFRPIISTQTDQRGYYRIDIPSNDIYDIYVRIGKRNPMQSIFIPKGQTVNIDFVISMKSISEEEGMQRSGFMIVVAIAMFVIIIIAIDQLFLRRRRELRELEQEREILKKRLGSSEKLTKDVELGELEKLKLEKNEIEYKINITKMKYHHREIDQESFREMVRDYQKRLVDIEARMDELKSQQQ